MQKAHAKDEEVKKLEVHEDKSASPEGLEVSDNAKITVTGGGVKKGEPVDVIGRNGEVVRTYSDELHGKDYMELAKVFIKKPNSVGFTLRGHDPKVVVE